MCTTCEIGQVRGPYFRRFFSHVLFFIEFYHPDGDEWFASFFLLFSVCIFVSGDCEFEEPKTEINGGFTCIFLDTT